MSSTGNTVVSPLTPPLQWGNSQAIQGQGEVLPMQMQGAAVAPVELATNPRVLDMPSELLDWDRRDR